MDPLPRQGAAFYGDRRCDLTHRLAGGTVNPEGVARGDKAEAPQSVRPQGAEKVPKQRPQTRGRKNGLKNGNTAQMGRKGQAEQQEISGAAGFSPAELG